MDITTARNTIYISTHSLLAEGDANAADYKPENITFQPTPSSRRETALGYLNGMADTISTHSLLAEGDALRAWIRKTLTGFQPTPSSRRETRVAALRAGCAGAFQPTPSSRRETKHRQPRL